MMMSLLLFFTNSALAYAPVADLSFPIKTEIKEYHFFNDITLKFIINQPENYKYNSMLLNRAILASTASSLNEIKSMGYLYSPCYTDEILEIYEVSEKELNNPKRFPEEFIGNGSWSKPNLWGYHDPRVDEVGYDSIMISPHTDDINYRIVVHEVAHYWYAAYCMQDRSKMTSEDFAKKIQEKEVYKKSW